MKADSVSLPGSFFTTTVPRIKDIAELKTVLYVTYLVLRKQERRGADIVGVTYRELATEGSQLLAEFGEEELRRALNSAVEHGALLHAASDIGGVLEDVYSLAADASRSPTVNVFALYEQNIGIITPMIAEELKEAENTYPPGWIEEALREAVTLNKRNWRYIARILERWACEGKDSGESKGDAKKGGPDKYVRGKYGHLVRR